MYEETLIELTEKYSKLANNIIPALRDFLKADEIPIFEIESRIKTEKSLLEKASRKKYSDPFKEIEDICGIRIICYYQEDINHICKIINNEFNVLSEENKRNDLSDNQFGYTSVHFIINLKPSWLDHPSARGLEGLKAEIQVRTMLMHTWAAISHKLLYKSTDDIPLQFRRKLNRLSALIELADEQFDAIRNEKNSYVKSFSHIDFTFNTSEELTSDSLVAVRTHYFPDRYFDEDDIPNLLSEIRSCGFNLGQLLKQIKSFSKITLEMELDESKELNCTPPLWSFNGLIRAILELSSDSYFEQRKATNLLPFINIEKYRGMK